MGPLAEVAHLVERDLAKVEVASSSLVFRSNIARLCNGSTTDFGSVCIGSNPVRVTKCLL